MATDRSISGIVPKVSKSTMRRLIDKCSQQDFPYRKTLNLPELYTFGNEIEFNCFFQGRLPYFVGKFNDKHALYEDERYETRNEVTASGEIVTPILTDKYYNWFVLNDMYKELVNTGATIGENTANHLHFGMHMINTPKELSLLIKTLVVFEPIIFKFGYGYDNHPRSFIEALQGQVNYCMMMSPKRTRKFIEALDCFDKSKDREMMHEFYDFGTGKDMFRAVFNFNTFDFKKFFDKEPNEKPSRYDHIEVRCFNGTLDARIVQNNINLITNIIRAVHDGEIDEEYVEQEYQKFIQKEYSFDHRTAVLYDIEEIKEYNGVLRSYNDIDWDKALKLADMIFKTELDKLLFLKQYLKIFSPENKEEVIARL
jgi:hypothetical protein